MEMEMENRLDMYKRVGVVQNSELSWLHFNERVLDEALNPANPILEQCRFISIFQTNFIEFFNVRVGILNKQLAESPKDYAKDSNLTYEDIQAQIYINSRELFKKMDTIYDKKINHLKRHGLNQLSFDELDKEDEKKLVDHYHRRLEPMLLPQVLKPGDYLSFKTNTDYLIYDLYKDGKIYYGVINYSTLEEKYYFLKDKSFIITEDYLGQMAKTYFKDYEIRDFVKIKMIRNMDKGTNIYPENSSTSKREHIRNLIHTRDTLEPVLVLASKKLVGNLKNFVQENLGVGINKVFFTSTPLNLSYFYDIEKDLSDERLVHPSYEQNTVFDHKISLSTQIVEKDKFIVTPYDDFDDFVSLIEESSVNQNVKTISISLYRIASNSRLLDGLLQARKHGKEVNVMIEMRARFDEADNLDHSQILRNAGCRISYGPASYKVHSKICLIEYIDGQKIGVVGTGNFHEKTANIYSDFYLLTADATICEDIKNVFDYFFLENDQADTQKLLVSPWSFKQTLIKKIDEEIEKKDKGSIFFKMNSLTDLEMIDKLVQASQAGVRVRVILRGKSSLIPGVRGYSENIEMRSIVGRFLEHARVYIFGDDLVYMGSADIMDRNLNRRVEVVAQMEDEDIIGSINKFMQIQWQDDVNGRKFDALGGLCPRETEPTGFSSQDYFIENKI